MQTRKHLALYQEPLIKVVAFTIERGFEDSYSEDSEETGWGPWGPKPVESTSDMTMSASDKDNNDYFSHSF
ncbi:MAG: hypothetical protein IJ785_04835 [Bacteroidales bacterium]|nr:hypothetical protein [Bacteroidales bacterium]